MNPRCGGVIAFNWRYIRFTNKPRGIFTATKMPQLREIRETKCIADTV